MRRFSLRVTVSQMCPGVDQGTRVMRKAYFDTCIISGVAKRDLPEAQQSAVSRLLEKRVEQPDGLLLNGREDRASPGP
jgi:hypothetical protein